MATKELSKGEDDTTTAESGQLTPAATSFVSFPAFPSEIKFLIWERTVEDRVIILDYDEKKGCFTTRCQAPAILHVHKQSRIFAQKTIYSVVEFAKSRQSPTEYFFYNEALNTLYFRKHADVDDVVKQQLFVTKLKYILDQVAPMETYIRPSFLSKRLTFNDIAMLQLLFVFLRDDKQFMVVFGVEKIQEIAIVDSDSQLYIEDGEGKGFYAACANNPKLVHQPGHHNRYLSFVAMNFFWKWLHGTLIDGSPRFTFTYMEIQYDTCVAAGKGSCSHPALVERVIDSETDDSSTYLDQLSYD